MMPNIRCDLFHTKAYLIPEKISRINFLAVAAICFTVGNIFALKWQKIEYLVIYAHFTRQVVFFLKANACVSN